MLPIEKCSVPANTMLETYSRNGGYADCYTTAIPGEISLAQLVFGFYTTFLFQLERFILKLTVSKPSTDFEVGELADGRIERFAAWHVEGRSKNELLMCDFRGRTRSWLMAVPANNKNDIQTQLYFGSAVVPVRNSKTGKLSLGFIYQALLGYHQIYSVLLLYSAKVRIKRMI